MNTDKKFKEIQLQLAWLKLKPGTKLNIIKKHEENWVLLYPGIWNLETGPDFLNAKIQINNKVYIGDIEIHKQTSDWISHKHSENKHYNNVMLHVVYNDNSKDNDLDSKLPNIPVMLLKPYFTIKKISESDKFPKGKCEKFFSSHSDENLHQLFHKAGLKKFKEKTDIFLSEMEVSGIDSTIFKHIFDACGYKQNRIQFCKLFDRINLYKHLSDKEYEAVLWGESGLLPDPSAISLPKETHNYTTSIWNTWWKIRKAPGETIEWFRGSNRPGNTPERRIAALTVLKKKLNNSPSTTLTKITNNASSEKDLIKQLKQLFICSHPLWNNFYSFTSQGKYSTNILGDSRASDIVINIALPALNAIGQITKNNKLSKNSINAYKTMSKAQDNRILKTAALKWFMPPSRQKNIFKNATSQQGAIYLYRGFCLEYCSECDKCPLNELTSSL